MVRAKTTSRQFFRWTCIVKYKLYFKFCAVLQDLSRQLFPVTRCSVVCKSFHSQKWKPPRNITSHSMKNLAFQAYSDEKTIVLRNSHCITYTFLHKTVGRMYFLNLEVKGLTELFSWICGYEVIRQCGRVALVSTDHRGGEEASRKPHTKISSQCVVNRKPTQGASATRLSDVNHCCDMRMNEI